MKNILKDVEVSMTEPLYGVITGTTRQYGQFMKAQKVGDGLYSLVYNGNAVTMESGWYWQSASTNYLPEKVDILDEMDFYGYGNSNKLYHGWACSSATAPDSACYIAPGDLDGTGSMTIFPGPSFGTLNGLKRFQGSLRMYRFDFERFGGEHGYVREPVPGVVYNRPDVYYNSPVGVHRYTIHLKYIDLNSVPIKGSDESLFDESLFSDSTPVTSFTSTYEYLCLELFYDVEGVDENDVKSFAVFDTKGNRMFDSEDCDVANLYEVPVGVGEIVVVLVVPREAEAS